MSFVQPTSSVFNIISQIKPAIIIFVLLTVITGIAYPLLVTGIAQIAFPWQAHGSLISVEGNPSGSSLIGQPFSSEKYFWGRPSATSPAYNSSLSSGSNVGPTNPVLKDRVVSSVELLHKGSPDLTQPIPVDLVTTSGSGLDPDMSVASAYYQIPRIAKERGIGEAELTTLVNQHIQGPQFGILGESRVNVLLLNQALDQYQASSSSGKQSISSDLTQKISDNSATVFGIRGTDCLQFVLFFIVLFALVVLVGRFMARIYQGEPTFISRITTPLEGWILRKSGIRADEEMDWKTFAGSLMIFNILGILVVFFLQQIQQYPSVKPSSGRSSCS